MTTPILRPNPVAVQQHLDDALLSTQQARLAVQAETVAELRRIQNGLVQAWEVACNADRPFLATTIRNSLDRVVALANRLEGGR